MGRWWVRWVVRLIVLGMVVWIVRAAPLAKNWPMLVSAVGWIVYSVYWSAAARNAAGTKSAESAKSRRVHNLLINGGLLLLFIPVPGLGQSFLPEAAGWVWAGLAMQAAALALAVWSRRHLGRNWSGRIEIKEGHELVRTGPYRVLRHPIYTAVIGMAAGTAVVDGRMHALVGVGLIGAAYWRKIRMEEAKLREAFGVEWEEHRRRTWGVLGVF